MKKILLMAFVLIISACSKSDDSSSENSSSIYGKWELISLMQDGEDRMDSSDIILHDIIEFKNPNTFQWSAVNLDFPNDESMIEENRGAFVLYGNLLKLNVTTTDGDPNHWTIDFIDVIVDNNTLTMVLEINNSSERIFYWKRIQ